MIIFEPVNTADSAITQLGERDVGGFGTVDAGRRAAVAIESVLYRCCLLDRKAMYKLCICGFFFPEVVDSDARSTP